MDLPHRAAFTRSFKLYRRASGARTKRSRKRRIDGSVASTLRYSQFEVDMARTGYARWKNVPIQSVNSDFVLESDKGVPFWAHRARYNMMIALSYAMEDPVVHHLFNKLPSAVLEYMIYDSGRGF